MFKNIILTVAVLTTILSIECTGVRLRRHNDSHAGDIVCDSSAMANSPHGKPQPIDSNPYEIIATSNEYKSESTITVTITGNDENKFKGFIVKASDATTNQPIGTWITIPGETRFIESCAAIFRTNFADATQSTLVWNAPANKQGRVKFTATVMKSMRVYWIDLIAAVKNL